MGIIEGLVLICVLFGMSIFVHELGHFMVARWCGLKIDAFSIGFGPALIKKNIQGVEWKICVLPLGGYVALPQMDPTGGQMAAEQGRTLPPVTPLKKIAVAVAGAVMNVLFAFVLAFAVYYIGKPAQPTELYSTVGYVAEDSEAYAEGLRVGDVILEVGSAQHMDQVISWNDVQMAASLQKEEVFLLVDQNGESKSMTVGLDDSMWGINTILGVEGLSFCRVMEVMEEMPAKEAGMKSGDLIEEINGEKLFSFRQLQEEVMTSGKAPVSLVVKRGDERFEFSVTPRDKTETYEVKIPRSGVLGRIRDVFGAETREETRTYTLIGIQWDPTGYDLENLVHPKPMDQIKYFSTTIFRILRALTTPSEAAQAAQGLSGPVGIFVMFWIFKASIGLAFWFTALLNINLAIMNLLPIPVLDGGHIMFSLWQFITRKPASPRLVMGLTKVFVVLLLSTFAILTLRDIDRFFLGGPQPPPDDMPQAIEAPLDPSTP